MYIEPPPVDDTLPDLHHLMASLEDGVPTEDRPLPKEAPPSLFSRPGHISKYKKISDLRLEVEDEEIEDYIREFEQGIKDDVLMIGSIGLEDVQVCVRLCVCACVCVCSNLKLELII